MKTIVVDKQIFKIKNEDYEHIEELEDKINSFSTVDYTLLDVNALAAAEVELDEFVVKITKDKEPTGFIDYIHFVV
jgi:hypothetical protein